MNADRQIPTWDVVVIGGGPAGSSVAALLAARGFDVVLLEKTKFPRNQVGESIIPHIWKFADRTGVSPKLEQEGFVVKDGGVTVWNGQVHRFAFSWFGIDRPSLHVERDRFDHILLQHAAACGADTREEVVVRRVDFGDPDRAVVVYDDLRGGETARGALGARFVIDASGHSTLLARQFRSRRLVQGERKFLSLWGYFKGARYVALDLKAYPAEKVMEVRPVTFVTSFEEGWVWHIPLREVTSIGLVINTDRIRGMGRREQEQYFLEMCSTLPYTRELTASATYVEDSICFRPDYSYRNEAICGERYCCIGDAGAFVDPIFSHGVQAAFYNANISAIMVEAAFHNEARRAHYMEILKGRLEQYYGFARSLALGDMGGDGVRPELVQSLMRSMPNEELLLMLMASEITDRSHHFREMARQAGVIERVDEITVSRERGLISEDIAL